MRMQLLRLATIALLLPLLTSCQTKSSASSTEVREAVKPLEDNAAALKLEFCRGQAPQEVPPEIYNAMDEFSRKYVRNNAQQWLEAGCSI
jgi:hypothetical protein